MAKFRQGNLILNATEKVIQGGTTVIDDSRAAIFNSYKGDTGATIQTFSTNTSLGTSDTAVPTQNAVKTYVDGKIAGSIGSSTDNALARYDGTDNIQGSGIVIDDSDNVTGIGNLTAGSGNDLVYLSSTGAIEIIDSGGNPYIDFKTASAEDRDCQIAQSSNGLTLSTGGNGSVSVALTLDSNQSATFAGNLSVEGTTKADGYFYAGDTAPDSTTRINYDGYFYATKVFNSTWNDYADFQLVQGKAIPGMCYYDTLDGAKLCTEYCQKSVIGIISDTYGMAVGIGEKNHHPIAVMGWALAYIDDDVVNKLEPGDALTSSSTGRLTKMLRKDVKAYPDRVVATYKKPERAKLWGPEGTQKLRVNGRHWVKIK